MFFKLGVLKKFTIFTGKHVYSVNFDNFPTVLEKTMIHQKLFDSFLSSLLKKEYENVNDPDDNER